MMTRKKLYCDVELDAADDEKEVLEKGIFDLEHAIVNVNDAITTTAGEIVALEDSTKVLDKEDRKAENEEYIALLTIVPATNELIGIAKKNKLNKFCNPKMCKAPTKEEFADEAQAKLPKLICVMTTMTK